MALWLILLVISIIAFGSSVILEGLGFIVGFIALVASLTAASIHFDIEPEKIVFSLAIGFIALYAALKFTGHWPEDDDKG